MGQRGKGGAGDVQPSDDVQLGLVVGGGGFADAEAPESYLRLAVWLGRLGCGYGLALGYLARVLRTEGDIDSRLKAVLADVR